MILPKGASLSVSNKNLAVSNKPLRNIPLILASASSRRLDLLAQIGLEPDFVIPAHIDETPTPKELPRQYAERMAKEKAAKIAQEHPNALIIAADTVVAMGRRIMPKAENIEDASLCLNKLSGRRHRVYGGICLIGPGMVIKERMAETVVSFKRLQKDEIDFYLASNEWLGKAGGYAIQGLAASFVRFISGSYSNIVGLSLYETYNLVKSYD